MQGNLFCVSQNSFSEFINQTGIVDYKLTKLSDIDLKFISTKSQGKEHNVNKNPERALIRYQFMETLVRIAEDRYINAGNEPPVRNWPRVLHEFLDSGKLVILNGRDKRVFKAIRVDLTVEELNLLEPKLRTNSKTVRTLYFPYL